MSLSVLKFNGVSYTALLEVNEALSGRERRMASLEERTGELTSNISERSKKEYFKVHVV